MPRNMIVYQISDAENLGNLAEAVDRIEDEAVGQSVIFNSDGSVPVAVWRLLMHALQVQTTWIGVRNQKTKKVLVLWSNVRERYTGQLTRSLMFTSEDLESKLEERILELTKEKYRGNPIAMLTNEGYTYNEVYVTYQLLRAEGKLPAPRYCGKKLPIAIHINQTQKQRVAEVLNNWAKTGCVIEKASEKGGNIYLVLENGTAFKIDIAGHGDWVVEGWQGGNEIIDVWQATKST